MADLVIELFDREPHGVCRETFSIIQFDSAGCIDVARYDKQQIALVNVILAPIFGGDEPAKNVVDATDKFVAQGGSWAPTDSLRDQMEKVAMGLLNCPAL